MRILIVTHANREYDPNGINNAWEFYPYYFSKLGYKVKLVKKKEWLLYPLICFRFKPEIIVSIGRFAGLITAIHHLFSLRTFVHDLTDHPHFYKSEKRIRFICRNHDYVTTPSRYNLDKFNCDYLIPNGSNFRQKKIKQEYDACYLGQVHGFYGIDELSSSCEKNSVRLNVVTGMSTSKVEAEIAKSKVCVFPISWDSSTKMSDYAAMGKAVVAIKPNLAEKIGYPAYYCDNLTDGISYLLKHPKLAKKLGKKAREWFIAYSGSWEQQSRKYIRFLDLVRQIFTMDVEQDIDAAVEFAQLLHKNGKIGEFYITGSLIERFPEKVKAIAKHHTIGGHGYIHENFAKLSMKQAESVIKKTIAVAKRHGITVKGWRFPGFSFNVQQLSLVSKYGLYDSSLRDKVYKSPFGFLHLWLSNLKRRDIGLPKSIPEIKEKPWTAVDLNDTLLHLRKGRLVYHCFTYSTLKKNIVKYLESI